MTNTRVLITGASGLLGATLSSFLAKEGYNIIRHSRRVGPRSDISCDLTDKNATIELLERTQPSAIVNLVALTNVDACEDSPHEAYLLNVRTVENLVSGMQQLTAPYLIQLSTDQVYDSVGPHSEENVRLTNVYALTKYAGELAAAIADSTILRTNFFGHSNSPLRQSLSDWLLKKLENNTPITTFTDVVTTPLTMETLSAMIGTVLEKRIKGVFNVGSREAMSKAQFASELAKAYKLSTNAVTNGSVSSMNLKAYRPKDMSMDCSRFESAFGVTLPSLKEEICKLKRDDDADFQ